MHGQQNIKKKSIVCLLLRAFFIKRSRDSSVSILTKIRAGKNRHILICFPERERNFSFTQKAQNGCGCQLIFYPVGAGSFSPDSKAAEASSAEGKNQWSEAFSSPYAFIS